MKTMRIYLKLLMFSLVLITLSCSPEDGETGPPGPQGEQGVQGIPGEDGNANVKAYEFTITAAQWGSNLHYGDNNIYRSYDIPPDQVGGVNIALFFSGGGAVLAYVKGGGTAGYSEWKITPHTYSIDLGSTYIGVRIECIPPRGSITICKTTNGWDAQDIADNELPANTEVKIILIEGTNAAKSSSTPPVNYNDYEAVKAYYHLKD